MGLQKYRNFQSETEVEQMIALFQRVAFLVLIYNKIDIVTMVCPFLFLDAIPFGGTYYIAYKTFLLKIKTEQSIFLSSTLDDRKQQLRCLVTLTFCL